MNKNKRLGYRRVTLRQRRITLEVKLMNYLQLEDIKCTVLRYSRLKCTVTLKPGLEVIQAYWKMAQFDIY